jgi:hypothetical protein
MNPVFPRQEFRISVCRLEANRSSRAACELRSVVAVRCLEGRREDTLPLSIGGSRLTARPRGPT